MKTLVLVLAAVGLSGCAVYPAPVYETAYDPGSPYVVAPPVYLQGSVYWFDYPNVYPRGYNRFRPGIFPRHAPPHGLGPRHGIREHNGFGNRQGRPPEPQRRR